MNIFDTLKANLESNGLFDTHATTIMAIAVESDSFDNVKNRWGDDASGYPEGFTNLLIAILRPIAYKWICENTPHAWFRAIFSPGIVGLEGNALKEYISNYHVDMTAVKSDENKEG